MEEKTRGIFTPFYNKGSQGANYLLTHTCILSMRAFYEKLTPDLTICYPHVSSL